MAAGSGDRNVYIWDASSRALMYKLPGHSGSVNEVVFHPKVRGGGGGWGLVGGCVMGGGLCDGWLVARAGGWELLPACTQQLCQHHACHSTRWPAVGASADPPTDPRPRQEPIVGSASSDKTIYLGELAV